MGKFPSLLMLLSLRRRSEHGALAKGRQIKSTNHAKHVKPRRILILHPLLAVEVNERDPKCPMMKKRPALRRMWIQTCRANWKRRSEHYVQINYDIIRHYPCF